MAKVSLKQARNLKANKSLWLIVVIVLLIIAALPSYYYYNQYKHTQELLQNPSAPVDNTQTKNLINRVGQLIMLPAGESPTVATVSDITKLAGQPFFANAKNGDKVLIFATNKEAIIFRESINKIVQVAPFNLAPAPSTTPVVQVSPTPATVTVAVYNGTNISGLANKASGKITAGMPGATIAAKSDSKANYTKTVVIDVSGSNSGAAAQIANLLGATVATSIPSGETKPTAQIMVILGTDFNQ